MKTYVLIIIGSLLGSSFGILISRMLAERPEVKIFGRDEPPSVEQRKSWAYEIPGPVINVNYPACIYRMTGDVNFTLSDKSPPNGTSVRLFVENKTDHDVKARFPVMWNFRQKPAPSGFVDTAVISPWSEEYFVLYYTDYSWKILVATGTMELSGGSNFWKGAIDTP